MHLWNKHRHYVDICILYQHVVQILSVGELLSRETGAADTELRNLCVSVWTCVIYRKQPSSTMTHLSHVIYCKYFLIALTFDLTAVSFNSHYLVLLCGCFCVFMSVFFKSARLVIVKFGFLPTAVFDFPKAFLLTLTGSYMLAQADIQSEQASDGWAV